MALEMLIKETEGMTDEEILEVIHYAQFLKVAPRRTFLFTSSDTSGEATIYRKPGLYKDGIKMLPGFDDPLDDFEEYM